MINIRESQQIFYNGGNEVVTIYRDADDANRIYIVPTPHFSVREVDGEPSRVFSLTTYENQDGAAGNCTFTVGLTVPPAALEAVRGELPNAEIAQFDWLSAQAFLIYNVGGKEMIQNAVPSMAGSNEATFSIDLPDQETVNAFEGAFEPGQTVSPFRVEFDVTTMAQLPAVDVTVTYDAQRAYEYEQSVDVQTDAWGTETSRRTTIREYLRMSDAGRVDVQWQTLPSDALRVRVEDWAWATLEGLVNQAADEAARTIGPGNEDQFSSVATSSFTRTYSENEVIEWVIQPTSQLPTFTSEESWEMHRSTVDNRRLITTFNLLQDFDAAGIDAVTLTVDYPTKPVGNSHVFSASAKSTSWVFEAPGAEVAGSFDPTYAFTYEVSYRDGTTFQSDPATTDATQVVVPLAALGIQEARFRGSNIDFENTIDHVEIHFFFATPGNQPNTVEVGTLRNNTDIITFTSRTKLPSANQYNYALVYVFEDGRTVRIDPVPVFPTQNQDMVTINSPFAERAIGFKVLNSSGAASIINASLSGTYVDQSVSGSRPAHDWNESYPPETAFAQSEVWKPLVLDNRAASYIEYRGTLLMMDEAGGFKQREINGFRTANSWANFANTSRNFSVTIDPRLIAWAEGIQAVETNAWTLTADGDKTAIQTRVFQPVTDAPDQAPHAQLASFLYPADQPSLTYYWSATYYHSDGTETYADKEASDSTVIMLPRDGSSSSLVALEVAVPSEALDRCDRMVTPALEAAEA